MTNALQKKSSFHHQPFMRFSQFKSFRLEWFWGKI